MSTRDGAELRRASVRLSAQFTALILVLLAIVGVLLYSIVAASTAEATNEALESASRVDSPRNAPSGIYVSALTGDGVESSRLMPGGLPDTVAMERVAATGTDERNSLSVGGRIFEVLTSYQGDRVIQVAVDTHESREQLDRLVWAMAIATTVAALLAAALSVWMARRAMRPIADSLALQRRFVADASHELRTPLTLLSTRAQLLRRKLAATEVDFPRQELSGEVSRIVEDSKLLTEILNDMLISADPRDAADHGTVDLVSIARDAVELAGPRAVERNIPLNLAGSVQPVEVQGSALALLRVFSSLVSNAMDHARTRVGITVRVDGRDARIEVSDDGPGFASGTEKRVFERFSSSRERRVDPGATRHYGLGLALAAEIVAHHQGTIRIEPVSPAEGGVVTVVLPLARSQGPSNPV